MDSSADRLANKGQPPKPEILPLSEAGLAHLPPKLIEAKCFVNWKITWIENRWAKVPTNLNGQRVDVTNPKHWQDLSGALHRYRSHPSELDGVGVVLHKEASIVGIDLDNCRDPRTGTLTQTAENFLTRFPGAYAEVSVSGTGVHILVPGRYTGERTKPKSKPNDETGLEIYRANRYFTLTGRLISSPATGAGHAARDFSDELQAIYGEFFEPTTVPSKCRDRVTIPHAKPKMESIVEPIARMVRGRTPFMREATTYYLHGITEGEDPSRADFRLVLALLYVTGDNPVKTDELFRTSALFRPDKWDSKRGATTYGWLTITNALRIRNKRAS